MDKKMSRRRAYAEHEAVDVGHCADVGRTLRHLLLGREVLACDVELAEERELNGDAVLHAAVLAHAASPQRLQSV